MPLCRAPQKALLLIATRHSLANTDEKCPDDFGRGFVRHSQPHIQFSAGFNDQNKAFIGNS
jgi:hypothetical protein